MYSPQTKEHRVVLWGHWPPCFPQGGLPFPQGQWGSLWGHRVPLQIQLQPCGLSPKTRCRGHSPNAELWGSAKRVFKTFQAHFWSHSTAVTWAHQSKYHKYIFCKKLLMPGCKEQIDLTDSPGPWAKPHMELTVVHTHYWSWWHPCPSPRGQLTLSLGAQGQDRLWSLHPHGCMVQDVSREGSRALAEANHSPMAAYHDPAPAEEMQTLPEPSHCKEVLYLYKQEFNPSFTFVFLLSCLSQQPSLVGARLGR